MSDCCKLGRISAKRVRYHADTKRYSIMFSDVKTADGRTIEYGIIEFDENLVRRVGQNCFEADLCQDTYPMRIAYETNQETVDVSLSALARARLQFFHTNHYVFAVSQKAVKESKIPGTKNVIFDLPIEFWDNAESRNCSVTVFAEQLIIQNYHNQTTMIFGRKENQVTIKFSFQRKDGSWQEQTMSAGRFWYAVKEAKEKKKKLAAY